MVLSEKGFRRPTYYELLNSRIDRAKKLFGEDIDTSEPSIFGKYIRMDIYDLAECYELLEDLYYARFPNTARGQSLDRLCPFANVTRDPADAAKVKVRLTGNQGAIITMGMLISGGGQEYYLADEYTIGEEGTVEALAICTINGEIGNLSNRTEFRLVENNIDIECITLLEVLSSGRGREDDTSLRKRFNKGILGSGSATINALYGELYRIEAVEDVYIDVNEMDEVINGIPPHSFECHVIAPESQEQLIAEAIFRKKPVGIKTHGSIEKTVLDKANKPHQVKFSKSVQRQVYVQMLVYTNQYFEEDGIGQIRTNVLAAINNLANGETLYSSSLYGYIHQVHGVYKVEDLKLSTDGETFEEQDITVSDYEVIRTALDQIKVVRP